MHILVSVINKRSLEVTHVHVTNQFRPVQKVSNGVSCLSKSSIVCAWLLTGGKKLRCNKFAGKKVIKYLVGPFQTLATVLVVYQSDIYLY